MSDPALLAARYRSVLIDRLGIPARVDANNNVRYRVGELNCVVDVRGGRDPQVMVLLCLFPLPREPEDMIAIASRVNRGQNPATVSMTDTALAIDVSMPVAGRDQLPAAAHLAAVLPVAHRMIGAAIADIQRQLHATNPGRPSHERTEPEGG